MSVRHNTNGATVSDTACEVDVLYIDYGNRERTTLGRLRPMPENFTKLPCHAFTCALAEVSLAANKSYLP